MTLLQWGELTRDRISEELASGATVAMAFGAVEQHGLHLPTATDVITAEHVLKAAAKQAASTVLVLPPMPFGLSNYHMRWGGTVTVGAETLISLFCDIARSVQACGARRFFIVNGHGGNRGICVTLSLTLSTPEFHVHAFPYWDLAPKAARTLFDADQGSLGHAGQAETSIVSALRPDLVRLDKLDGHEPIGPAMGLVAVQRLGESGVSGDPASSQTDLGRQFLDLVVDKLATLFDARDLAHLALLAER